MNINYITENPSSEYAKAIRTATTLPELVSVITRFREVADDALVAARGMTGQDFADFKRDIMQVHRKHSDKWIDEFNRKFGAIAMPIKLVVSTIVADKYGAPWGAAFIRCKEEGWPMISNK